MLDDSDASPPSSRDVAGEDFLFHLYRGSELLQDNRVHEAKQELENALNLQPRDEKGQDLLAIVYFRLGLYPRAISIYVALIASHPNAVTPRVNLALCYLKTGQPAAARSELERVLELSPNHGRAWGYLGLAFQRIGDYERAWHAFTTGGHEVMARRLVDMTGIQTGQSQPASPAVVKAAQDAFEELDRKDFKTDVDGGEGRPSGTWSALEPGREPFGERRSSGQWTAIAAQPSPSLVPSLAPSQSLGPTSVSSEGSMRFPLPSASPNVGGPSVHPSRPPLAFAEPAEQLARNLLLVFPRSQPAALHTSGLVLMQTQRGLCVRFDAIRTMTFPANASTRALSRRLRGRDLDEPFGGVASPLVEIEGAGSLVLGPGLGAKLSVVTTNDDALYVRESLLVAMETSVVYENGKLAGGDGDFVPVVQLKGSGAIVLGMPANVVSIEVVRKSHTLVRAHTLLGWTGRIVPRPLPPAEAPGKMRGLVALTGEGMALVDAR